MQRTPTFITKIPFFLIGTFFIGGSLIATVPVALINKFLREPYERYDYKEIVRDGVRKNARVTDISLNINSTYNGINPRIISYEYRSGDSICTDKFQTVDLDKVVSLSKSDSITVFVLNGRSVIDNIKPYTFPVEVLWALPGIFLFIGLALFCAGHFAGVKNVKNK